ncbi:MAG: DUF4919 domain-containing protein [Alistipes sp.]|nr:DUF4919 domain-containing protein [Alistipes sp.]
MKKLLLLLLLALPLAGAAKIPDEEDIIRHTLDSESPFYYPNLMMRYQAGDNTLTEEEYHYLYYGYAYQENYKPFAAAADMERALATAAAIDFNDPSRESLEQLITAVHDAQRFDPFSPKLLNLLAYAYGALGDGRNEQRNFNRMNAILATIEESGEGLKEGNAWHILMFGHALDLLAAHGRYPGKARIVSRSVEYIPLLEPVRTEQGRIKGYYFDYSRIYRNKPDGYVFERPRTWQFNNLRPRKYK